MLPDNQASVNEQQRQIGFAKFVLLNADPIRVDLAKNGGEYSDTLTSLAMPKGSGSSSGEFESWLWRHREALISASDPETLLTELRLSNLTP